MIVEKTTLPGVLLVKPDIFEDYRGNFIETYHEQAYHAMGMEAKFVQSDVSVSYHGVLRGMHGDGVTTKLVQCLHGRVYAVVADCDEASPSFGKWESFILSDANSHQLYIPPMYGNGYYVLSDKCVYSYMQSAYYTGNQFTVKWNDPRFKIRWPGEHPILSARDAEC